MAKTSMSVPWGEGSAEDFSELHEALKAGKTKKFSAADDSDAQGAAGFSDSENDADDDEVEVEPSPDDHGNTCVPDLLEQYLKSQHPLFMRVSFNNDTAWLFTSIF